MFPKYRADKRVPKKKKRYKILKFLLRYGILVGIFVLIWLYLRRPHVKINDAGAQLAAITFPEAAKVHIKEPLYEFDLPGDWKELSRSSYPYHLVTWKGTAKESAARTIEVYSDVFPMTLAVNRVLPVISEDDRLAVDEASENCVLMNPDTASLTPEQATKHSVMTMTFQDVKFYCDIPNSLRNVVAAGSTEGINRFTLTGAKGGKHKYFIVYTDHAGHEDEKTFPDMLRSFRAI